MSLKSPFTKRRRGLCIIVAVIYATAFLVLRLTHVLVHRVSYATEPSGRVYFHQVTGGDFGPGLLVGDAVRIGVPVAHWVFTPLRWAESLAWRVIPREYGFEKRAASALPSTAIAADATMAASPKFLLLEIHL